MKKLAIVVLGLVLSAGIFAQDAGKKLPSVELKTLDGKTVNMSEISNDGKPIYISFWAIWCTNCIKELNAIQEVYDEWQEDNGVKLYAVSIDDARNKSKVAPFAAGKGWEFDVLSDVNQDFKRAMNVNMPPHSFILDGDGNIVWNHVGYHEGDEEHIKEILDKVAAGETIKPGE